MRDIHVEAGEHRIDIHKVGIKGIRYPILVPDKRNGSQQTTGSCNLYVDLHRDLRGAHMSRFVRTLAEHNDFSTDDKIKGFLESFKNELEADKAYLELNFPFFAPKKSPVSDLEGLQDYNVRIKACKNCDECEFALRVEIPVQSLCPCSKEISEYGAHNQRSIIKITIKSGKLFYIEDLIAIGERNASQPTYPILKRIDEKYVTEHAYNNPKFVEDIVRGLANDLEQMEEVSYYKVESENFESIHNHNVFAMIENHREEK